MLSGQQEGMIGMFSQTGRSAFAMEFPIFFYTYFNKNVNILERSRGWGKGMAVHESLFWQGCINIPWVIWTCGMFNHLAGALSLKAGTPVLNK